VAIQAYLANLQRQVSATIAASVALTRTQVALTQFRDWTTLGFTPGNISFFRTSNGQWYCDMDFYKLLDANIAGWQAYTVTYLSPTGADGNAGTVSAPKKTIDTVWTDATNRILILDTENGEFDYITGFKGNSPGANKVVVSKFGAAGKRATVTMKSPGPYTWVADTTPGVYYTVVSTTMHYAIDYAKQDLTGRPFRYDSRYWLKANFVSGTPDLNINTLALCRSNVGTLFYDSGTSRVYINTGDTVNSPSSSVVIYRGTACVVHNTPANQVWFNGVDIVGGSIPVSSVNTVTSIVNGFFNMTISLGTQTAEGGLLMDGPGTTYLQNVTVVDIPADGFDSKNTRQVIADNINGKYCGLHQYFVTGVTYHCYNYKKNQATTCHGSKMISVNSEFSFSGGANVQDVVLSAVPAYHLALGAYIHDGQSTDRASDTFPADIFVGSTSGDTSRNWLIDVKWTDRYGAPSRAPRRISGTSGTVYLDTNETQQGLYDLAGTPTTAVIVPSRF